MSAYRMAIGAAVLTLLGIGIAGTAGGIVVAALLLLARVGWLCVMEDATGRSRFLGAGVLSLALALRPGVSEAATLDAVDNTQAYVLSEGGKVVVVAGLAAIIFGGVRLMFSHGAHGAKMAAYGLLGMIVGFIATSGQAEALAHRLAGG